MWSFPLQLLMYIVCVSVFPPSLQMVAAAAATPAPDPEALQAVTQELQSTKDSLTQSQTRFTQSQARTTQLEGQVETLNRVGV